MSKKEALWMITIVVVFLGGFFYYMKFIFKPKPKQPTEILATSTGPKPVLSVEKKEWPLPKELKEISANVFLDDVRMACVQDNDGIIYIYNLQSESVDEKIKFADNGDYEGLAIVQNTFYVLRSDGFLFEVQPQKDKTPLVKTYDLPLEMENETESLCYDSENNRLLIGVKEHDLQEQDKKGIYGFDLKTKQMSTNAVLYIDSKVSIDDNDDDGKKNDKGKKKKKGKAEIKPSGIAIHPTSRDLYILDGPSSRMFIADSKGNIKSKIQLDKKVFPQPEGLCFNKSGELYISSEGGKDGQGVIVKFTPNAI
jgi:hypothetical protein